MNHKIRIWIKGRPTPLTTQEMSATDAELMLREEVLPKIGKPGRIELPGLVINANEVAAAETSPTSRARRRPRQRTR